MENKNIEELINEYNSSKNDSESEEVTLYALPEFNSGGGDGDCCGGVDCDDGGCCCCMCLKCCCFCQTE